ncbi:CpsD/CapB family tyrosine-protein kinase [Lysinibacillus agricola]|uniref:non-specific protein-tyrosine kinase n=1 Tax=Lysinibacillus agricola TaxID=2590012 RepID=A0ABX7AV28_9BACI|nr:MULTISPECIES: CpsD/CapB family tyrosine-protein kinase [Lysinibacillus]KOS62733.1 capsular biosynthesis protein [Lysinibacillus sp. FJAT-14222]QQP13704.1 CpsD/CapB family tyrosine-protein kinase [Lysinibacillus agricola]
MFRTKKKRKLLTLARKLVTVYDSKSILSEQFRTIRTNITFSLCEQDEKTMLITSSIPGEGKSTNAANIGIVFAQEGKKVLLVDADMRKPTIHHTFHLTNTVGLSSLLIRQKILETIIQTTSVEGLSVITSGPIPPNPAELLASKAMNEFFETVKKEFDIVIFDAPPLLSVTDAQILANKCDGTLLIVNTGVVEKLNVIKAKSILINAQAKILGVVLNNYVFPRNHHSNQYYNSIE